MSVWAAQRKKGSFSPFERCLTRTGIACKTYNSIILTLNSPAHSSFVEVLTSTASDRRLLSALNDTSAQLREPWRCASLVGRLGMIEEKHLVMSFGENVQFRCFAGCRF